MLRATDAHAKNFSIFLRPGGTYELTPLCDVLSAYPAIGTGANRLSPFRPKIAMAVCPKNTLRDIVRRHWLAVRKEHGVVAPDGRGVEVVIDNIITKTPKVVRSSRAMLPKKFPKRVADSILKGLQVAIDKLAG
jgi:serine/threonine-protein kinase HipA